VNWIPSYVSSIISLCALSSAVWTNPTGRPPAGVNDVTDTALKWRLIRRILTRTVSSAARRILANRTLTDTDGHSSRWLYPEIERFLEALEEEAEALRPGARLETLPSFGNRLMVELAVYTAACDRVLRREGIEPATARQAVGDLGWDLYWRMLSLTSLHVRLITRDSGRRLRWMIRMLLRFPFNAPGAPGYAVNSWIEGDDILTHFTHCPPQSYVRQLSEETGDMDTLEAFRASWCLYDWAGADVIAGDGRRGHYRRRQTLSHGDPVCDMCWVARTSGGAQHGPRTVPPRDVAET
jgi:hypothetical protein